MYGWRYDGILEIFVEGSGRKQTSSVVTNHGDLGSGITPKLSCLEQCNRLGFYES